MNLKAEALVWTIRPITFLQRRCTSSIPKGGAQYECNASTLQLGTLQLHYIININLSTPDKYLRWYIQPISIFVKSVQFSLALV
jgi:hypothetical protein